MTTVTLIVAFNALVFWPKRWTRPEAIFLNLIAVPLDIIYGANTAAGQTLYSNTWMIGAAIIILGMFCLFRTVMIIIAGKKGGAGEKSD